MNTLIKLSILLLVTACSTTRFERTTAPENDALIVESTIRFDGKRLNEWAESKGVLGEATKLCQLGETSEGQELLKKNLNSQRKSPAYWMVVGNCHWHAGNGAKAEYFYKLALGLAKKDQRIADAVYNNLGLLYMQRSLYPEARAEFEKAKDSLTAKYNLAQIALLLGDARSAKSHLAEIYRVNRRDPDVLASMAVAHLLDGNTKVAMQVLNEIPKNESDRQDVAFYRAMGLYLNGDVENAGAELDRALKTDSSVSRLSDMAKELENLVKLEVERRLAAQEAAQNVKS